MEATVLFYLMFIAIAVNDTGLVKWLEKKLGKQFLVISHPVRFTFCMVFVYSLRNTGRLIESLAVSFFMSYLSLCFHLCLVIMRYIFKKALNRFAHPHGRANAQ